MSEIEHLRPKSHLTFGEVAAILEYNPLTGELFWKARGEPKFDGKFAGRRAGTRKRGRWVIGTSISGRHEMYFASRVAWLLFYGEWPSRIVDHKDGDSSNDRIKNLRLASCVQNSANRNTLVGKIGYRGVCRIRNGTFAAQITSRGKSHWIGTFNDAADAARAYDRAAVEHHGEFAVTNVSMGLL